MHCNIAGFMLMVVILSLIAPSLVAQSSTWENLNVEFSDVVSGSLSSDRIVFVETRNDGLLRSTDFGSSWEVVSRLEPGRSAGLVSSYDRVVLLVRDDSAMVSFDNGSSWMAPVVVNTIDSTTINAITATPLGMMLAGTVHGHLMHSLDSGRTWEIIELNHFYLCSLNEFDTYRNMQIVIASGCGVFTYGINDFGVYTQPPSPRTEEYDINRIVTFEGSGIAVATTQGIYAGSGPGGRLIPSSGDTSGTVTSFAQYLDTDTVYASTIEHGIIRSSDKGYTWSSWNFNLSADQPYNFVVCGSDGVLAFSSDSVYRLSDSTAPIPTIVHSTETQASFQTHLRGDRLVISGGPSLHDVEAIHIYNILGQEAAVRQQIHRTGPTEIAVEIGNLQHGMYFVELRTESGVAGVCRFGVW